MPKQAHDQDIAMFNNDGLCEEVRNTKLYKYLDVPKTVSGLMGRLEELINQKGIEHITYTRYDSEQYVSTVPKNMHQEYLVQKLFKYDWTHKLNQYYTFSRFYGDIRRLFINSFHMDSQMDLLEPEMLSQYDDDLRANNEILRIMHEQQFAEYFLIPDRSVVGNSNFTVSLSSSNIPADKFRSQIHPLIPFLRLLAKIIDEILCHRHCLVEMDTRIPPQDLSLPSLTTTEMNILHELRKGLKAIDIAKQRNRSIGTIRTHIKSIKRKLDAKTLIDAINKARQYESNGPATVIHSII